MIYLVTDSTACVSRPEARELDIIVVPMHYIKNGQEAFTEGYIEDSAPQAVRSENLAQFSTAQAPTSAFLEVFDRLKQQGHQALCLTISSRLSGTYSNAVRAAQEVDGGFVVVDSRTTAGAMYLMLKEARTLLNEGKGLEETAAALKTMRKLSQTIFTIQDMEPLRRSGRLGVVRLSVSTLLNVRPVLALQDGAVVTHALARGRQVQMRQLMDGVEAAQDPIIVQHAGDEEAAGSLTQRLAQQDRQVIQRRLGMVLAIHLGLPVLSTAWLVKE